jgi:large subunit ribosomal protein L22
VVARAVVRHIRISSRKVREVIDLIRGKQVAKAHAILSSTNKGAVVAVRRVLNSAVANARVKDPRLNEEELYISRITADDGPILYRYRAAPMGRGLRIRRRTSHIVVELEVSGNGK